MSPEERHIITDNFSSSYKVNSLAAIEIFGSKINALISRAAARDLYDISNMIRFGIFDESQEELLRKVTVFYGAISAKAINKTFDTAAVDNINKSKITRDLYPVIKKKDGFQLEVSKEQVKSYIKNLMILTSDEVKFLDMFESGSYMPELLFGDKDILERIENHPMAIWKMKNHR